MLQLFFCFTAFSLQTVSELFEQYVDLNALVTRKFLSELATFATDQKEGAEMRRLVSDAKSSELQQFMQANRTGRRFSFFRMKKRIYFVKCP